VGPSASFSVIVCCYNSSERLPITLRHLAALSVEKIDHWELIIVDNASTDDTATVARRLWASFGSDIACTIIHEPQPGLIFARKAGLNAARFSMVLFCDDDNWLPPNYLSLAVKIMEEHPDAGAIGGRAEAVAAASSDEVEQVVSELDRLTVTLSHHEQTLGSCVKFCDSDYTKLRLHWSAAL
jgi:glycosyltransferase involved in cell wall biosynthesis